MAPKAGDQKGKARSRKKKSPNPPPPEILQLVRSLAIDDARRDHEEEMERLRRERKAKDGGAN